jgi:hypothetical protein
MLTVFCENSEHRWPGRNTKYIVAAYVRPWRMQSVTKLRVHMRIG